MFIFLYFRHTYPSTWGSIACWYAYSTYVRTYRTCIGLYWWVNSFLGTVRTGPEILSVLVALNADTCVYLLHPSTVITASSTWRKQPTISKDWTFSGALKSQGACSTIFSLFPLESVRKYCTVHAWKFHRTDVRKFWFLWVSTLADVCTVHVHTYVLTYIHHVHTYIYIAYVSDCCLSSASHALGNPVNCAVCSYVHVLSSLLSTCM